MANRRDFTLNHEVLEPVRERKSTSNPRGEKEFVLVAPGLFFSPCGLKCGVYSRVAPPPPPPLPFPPRPDRLWLVAVAAARGTAPLTDSGPWGSVEQDASRSAVFKGPRFSETGAPESSSCVIWQEQFIREESERQGPRTGV